MVVEKNDAVLQNPLLVNEAPYDNGWLVKIEPINWEEESATLVSGDALSEWMDAEIERFESQDIAG
jgi:glycine cleavage system H lipoate-binding protein